MDITKAVSMILIVQAIVSGLVALAIIGGTFYMARRLGSAEDAFEILKSWGAS